MAIFIFLVARLRPVVTLAFDNIQNPGCDIKAARHCCFA